MLIEILGFVGKLSTEKVTLSVSYIFCVNIVLVLLHAYCCVLYNIANERHITLKSILNATSVQNSRKIGCVSQDFEANTRMFLVK